jgi:hypothetical protein
MTKKAVLKKDSPFLVTNNLFVHAETLLKSVNTAAGINQLLSSCEERMALGTNFNADLISSRLGLESSAASALYCNSLVIRMDALFHCDFHLFVKICGLSVSVAISCDLPLNIPR